MSERQIFAGLWLTVVWIALVWGVEIKIEDNLARRHRIIPWRLEAPLIVSAIALFCGGLVGIWLLVTVNP